MLQMTLATVLLDTKGKDVLTEVSLPDLWDESIKVTFSLVPRPLPDFILQLWRKIGRRPGNITASRTRNGGLGYYEPSPHYVLTATR